VVKYFCFYQTSFIFYTKQVIKNVSFSTSHKKTLSFRLYICTRIYKNNSGHIQHQRSAVFQPAMQLRDTLIGLGKRESTLEGYNVSPSTTHKNTIFSSVLWEFKILPNIFIYDLILIKICMNANIINKQIFHFQSMTKVIKVHKRSLLFQKFIFHTYLFFCLRSFS
jgi:hypothetical protein